MNNISESSGPVTTLNKKIMCSAFAAAIFMLVSLPQTYTYSSKLTPTMTESCPTPEGKFIHAALFFAINYFLMKLAASQKFHGMETKSDGLLAKYAFIGTLLFFLLSSTDSYRLTGKLVSGLANEAGCPEVKGVIVHGLVFLVLLVLMMYFPKDC